MRNSDAAGDVSVLYIVVILQNREMSTTTRPIPILVSVLKHARRSRKRDSIHIVTEPFICTCPHDDSQY